MFNANVGRCYVDKSNTCKDATPSTSRPGWVWSCEACDTHGKKKEEGCTKRKRKNANSLSSAEKDKLVGAMNRLIGNGRYVELGNIHGGPKEANVCPGKTDYEMVARGVGGCCRHDKRNFLNWHRIFIAHVEDELGEALPYWDWTVDRKVPDLWEGIKAPFHPPITSTCKPGEPYVVRKKHMNMNWDKFKHDVAVAMEKEDFDSFHNAINTPHNDVHNQAGCELKPPQNAAYDPLFYLHHSFVDFLWAFWQELQKHRGVDVSRSYKGIPELKEPLHPFDRADYNDNAKTLKHSIGTDVVDYQSNLCYEYEDLRFSGYTPSEYKEWLEKSGFNTLNKAKVHSFFRSGKESGKCEDVCSEVNNIKNCEAMCYSGKYYVKVYVAVVMPKLAQSGVYAFSLCQDGECVNSGTVSTFGDFGVHTVLQPGEIVDDKKFHIVEDDVTDVMVKEGWSFKKSLKAKMIDKVMKNLPEPVVIIKTFGKGRKLKKNKLKFSSNEKRESYGNLLDKYKLDAP